VYFSGRPPYASTLDTDGSEPILLGDFNSPPRAQPYSGDWVMHPGASVPYRSLPVALTNTDPRWDGTDWCTSSQFMTVDIQTFRHQAELPTFQLFNCPAPPHRLDLALRSTFHTGAGIHPDQDDRRDAAFVLGLEAPLKVAPWINPHQRDQPFRKSGPKHGPSPCELASSCGSTCPLPARQRASS
jgi:hypothetical protein